MQPFDSETPHVAASKPFWQRLRQQIFPVILTWFFLVLFFPPLVSLGLNTFGGAARVALTGMCPAEPLDIPAHPCTVIEYLHGAPAGWNAIGAFMLMTRWCLLTHLAAVPYLVYAGARRKLAPLLSLFLAAVAATPFGFVLFMDLTVYGFALFSMFFLPPTLIALSLLRAKRIWKEAGFKRALGVASLGMGGAFLSFGLLRMWMDSAR